ncbi:MAG: Nif3-like dinuclear metal center hexameric protein [Candidatus Thorarchaeota archaeon]
MDAHRLFLQLDEDFELKKCSEGDWDLSDLGDFVTESFMKTNMGLVLDNTESIEKVYTAVFPSDEVISRLLDSGEKDILLFTHHPMIWDPRLEGSPFRNIRHDFLSKLKEERISYYAIHVPLDRNGPYSTTVSLAKAVGVEPKSYFFDYFGSEVGVMGRTDRPTVSAFAEGVKSAVGHKVKVWRYGSEEIKDSQVALVAGGGGEPEIASEIAEADLNMYVTGVTRMVETYEPSILFHDVCKENEINVIGATHYSTEKFACIALVDYFLNIGLACEFIEDKPSLEDLE